MSAIKLRVTIPALSMKEGPTILSKTLDALNRPPNPTPDQVRYVQLQKQVSGELNQLLQRARVRSYTDTMSVLSFYWLLTIRKKHSDDHFVVLEAEIDKQLINPYLSAPEILALEGCKRWVGSARFTTVNRRRTKLPAAGFTSERFAPPEFATQAFLENLLNCWLPQSIVETYGQRLVEESWGAENAYAEAAFCLETILQRRAVFPETEVVRRLDILQKRVPTSEEDLTTFRRRQQASLEALVLASGKDASAFDPKLREILTDVVLFLLGITAPAPPPHPGRAWLLPAFTGTDLPLDLAGEVSEFTLPADYVNREAVTIPVSNWQMPLDSRDSLHSMSLHSSILTPDGRVWDAVSVAQESGGRAALVFSAIGRVDAKPAAEGSVLAVPFGGLPREVSARLGEMTEMDIYHHRWHLDRIEALEGHATGFFKVLHVQAEPEPQVQRRSTAVAGDEVRMLRAS